MEHLLARKITDLKPSATEEVFNEARNLVREGVTNLICLDVGEPDFETPQNIVDAACAALRAGETKYQPTFGAYGLREEISKKLKNENGIDTVPENIMVTPGAKFAVFLALHAVLEPGDQVVLLEPAWVSYEAIGHLTGAQVIKLPSRPQDGFKPDLDALRRVMTPSVKMIVLNSPCNPTGTVLDRSTIRSIAELAKEFGALILTDEIYEYLICDGTHYSPASEYDNVVTANGFSKGFAMTGWRLGYVTGPKAVMEGMEKIQQHSVSHVTTFAQAGALEALRSKASQKSVKQMVDSYRRRRQLMLDLITASPFFECLCPPQGAFYCFPSYSGDEKSVSFAKKLLHECRVSVLPGAAFGQSGEGHLRLSYATDDDQISEAFQRMDLFLGGK
jgi:aspartate aminotransferase